MTQCAYDIQKAQEEARSPLSPQQVSAFMRDGFLIVPSVFNRADVNKLSRAVDALACIALDGPAERARFDSQFVVSENSLGVPRIERVVGVGGTIPFLGEMGQSPKLVRMAAQLLEQSQLKQLINQVHFKFPGDEVEFQWHQDSRHRRYGTHEWKDVNGRGSFVETITAIDPMHMDNGPIMVIPGSHLAGHIDVSGDGKTLPQKHLRLDDAVPALLNPGDVLLLGPFTIHGSAPNQSQRSRRIFLNGFALPEANGRRYPWLGTGRQVST